MDIDYKQRLAGTNIDPRSLLSTDYFNHFNEVIMMLGMLPGMLEMLDEIDQWSFRSYCDHFTKSSLTIAPLAIELYQNVPYKLRIEFETLVKQMSALILETRASLRQAMEAGDMEQFARIAKRSSQQLQGMVDMGSAIVHGYGGSLDQEDINKLF